MNNMLNQLFQSLGQDTTTVLLAVVAFTLLFLTIKSNRKPTKTLPPGPRFKWPILGNLPSLDPKAPFKTLNQMALKYGPVYRLQFGSFPMVILNDFESVRQAFVKQSYEFDDRPNILVFEVDNREKGLIGAHSSQPFSPYHPLEIVTCNVVCCLVFGHGFDYDDQKLLHILNSLKQIFEESSFAGLANFVPWMRYLPFSGFQNIKQLGHENDDFIREMIKMSRETYTRGDPCNFIDMYLDNQEKIQEENPDMTEWFDDKDLVQCIADLFAAGTETSSTTLKWGLLYMVLQPDIQDKIHAELDSQVGSDRMPTLKDRSRLPYTEATLLEIQRIGSIGPLGIPRAATIDTKLYGYDIEKATMVMPNLWAIHHDEKIWKEPESFKPERFLDPDGKLNRREELIPFVMGKRKCLGEELALMELFIIFTHLLHRFSFRLPEGAQPSLEPDMGMSLIPKEYNVVAVPRN